MCFPPSPPRFASCFFFFFLISFPTHPLPVAALCLLGNHLSPLIAKHHRRSLDITRRLQQEEDIHPLLPFISPASAIPLYPSISTHSFFLTAQKIITCLLGSPEQSGVFCIMCEQRWNKTVDEGGTRRREQDGAERRDSHLYFALYFHPLQSSLFMFCLLFGMLMLISFPAGLSLPPSSSFSLSNPFILSRCSQPQFLFQASFCCTIGEHIL